MITNMITRYAHDIRVHEPVLLKHSGRKTDLWLITKFFLCAQKNKCFHRLLQRKIYVFIRPLLNQLERRKSLLCDYASWSIILGTQIFIKARSTHAHGVWILNHKHCFFAHVVSKYANFLGKRRLLHKKRVQSPRYFFLYSPTWPPFHCFEHQRP